MQKLHTVFWILAFLRDPRPEVGFKRPGMLEKERCRWGELDMLREFALLYLDAE